MREWNIKAGQQCMDGIVYADCDGPVPELNEIVPVVEKKFYEDVNHKLQIARHSLCKLGAVLLAMKADPNIIKIVDDAMDATGEA